jgi:ABC-type amino acid transport substrate-binding protein
MTARTSPLRRGWPAVFAAAALLLATAPAAAGVLDRARETSKLSFGYRADLRPFSHADAGAPAGYSIALCQRVADAVKSALKLPELRVEWVPVTAADRFEQLAQGRIDADCGADTPTLGRRASVDFSIPIALAGVGAAMRVDGDRRVRDALSGRSATALPVWRGRPGDLGGEVTLAVVGGSTIERDLLQALAHRRITVTAASVPDYAAGVRMVLERRAAALFGDRPVLLDAAQRAPAAGQLVVLERRFSRESIALALPRADDDFRLLVDGTLSRFYRSPDFAALYAAHFGAPDAAMLEFFQLVALPE